MAFLLVAQAGFAIGSAVFGGKKRKAEKKARTAQANIQKIRNAQEKRKFLQAFRQSQAASLAEGIATGASIDSSATQGKLASTKTQAAFGVFEQGLQERFAAQSSSQLNKADRAGFASDLLSTAGSLAGPIADTIAQE